MNAYEWDDLVLGLSAELQVIVTEEMMDHFRHITGDVNPLHVDRGYAVEQGFADRVVYGLLTASFYSTLAGMYLPGKHCLLHGLDVGFHKPVYAGDCLLVRGEVAYRNEVFRRAELLCVTVNQQGEKVAAGKLRVGVRAEARACA
jgi:3-hydroxybutyryl-CoA dehydratase